jgi:hypothetical protein
MTKLPTLVYVRDYHDFDFMVNAYDQLKMNVKVEELGFDDTTYKYVGLVFKGRRPSKAKIAALLKKFEVVFSD